jgi:serine protease AprX
MTHTASLRRATLLASAFALATASPVLAAGGSGAPSAGHRARMSEDLADHLARGSQQIDVIVHGTRAEVDSLARQYNLRVKRYLKNGGVLRITAGQLAALQADETIDHLSADIPIHSIADVTAETIGADQVWAGVGDLPPLSGEGVGVAVIDSGVDPKHSALKNRVIVTKDFTGGDGVDRYGHGTHVAAIIAGRPGRTVDTAAYQGIATGSRIVNLRVLDENGAGFASDVIEAIDWAVDNRRAYNIRVINLSLGAPVTQPYRDDPICEAVERAVAAGVIVVAAAGNYGISADGRQVYGSIATPGNDPNVITVGALDAHDTAERSDDTVAKYSSRGPTRFDLVLKPDLVAPGNHIVSAEATGSYLSKTYSQRHVAGVASNAYIQLNGTSMAAGVVSGTVALLLEERPKLAPRAMKSILQVTSSLMTREGLVASGAGSLNVLAAAQFGGNPRRDFTSTFIAGETIHISGLVFAETSVTRVQFRQDSSSGHRVRASQSRWERQNKLLALTGRPIFVGTADHDSIFWGTADHDSIFWGTADADSIFWGTADPDSIFWGTAGPDSIFWGTADRDSIFWGTADPDSIFWGTADTDSIFWGTAALND